MAFLRRETSEGNIGLIYSIIQKTIRRGLENKCLYYSKILYNEGTPNSLRKRLCYIINEDIGHIVLSNEVMNCEDSELFKYVIICCRLKKTHDPAWLSRLSLDYCINNKHTNDFELNEGKKLTYLVKNKDYKNIRKYINKYSKLYTFTDKNNLVWASYILFNNRKELNQPYDLNLELIEPKKFDIIPFWVRDKHVIGGVSGYKFFFENSLVVNIKLYESGDKFGDECKKVYLDDENNGLNSKTKHIQKLWNDIEKFEKKIDGYIDVIQIQLITSKGKPNTYFATDVTNNKKYVLKGPIDYKFSKQVQTTELLKKKLKLPELNIEIININDIRWIKSDCLLDYNTNSKILKSSKLEENVLIYNSDNCNVDFDTMIDTHFIKIFEQYLFRLLCGCNDHCSRNFIYKNDIIYSIDDHSLDLPITNLDNIKMKKKTKEIWNKKIIDNKIEILNILKKWINLLTSDKYKQKCYDLISLIL